MKKCTIQIKCCNVWIVSFKWWILQPNCNCWQQPQSCKKKYSLHWRKESGTRGVFRPDASFPRAQTSRKNSWSNRHMFSEFTRSSYIFSYLFAQHNWKATRKYHFWDHTRKRDGDNTSNHITEKYIVTSVDLKIYIFIKPGHIRTSNYFISYYPQVTGRSRIVILTAYTVDWFTQSVFQGHTSRSVQMWNIYRATVWEQTKYVRLQLMLFYFLYASSVFKSEKSFLCSTLPPPSLCRLCCYETFKFSLNYESLNQILQLLVNGTDSLKRKISIFNLC